MFREPKIFSTAYNFGPNSNDVLSVKSMVEKAISIFGSGKYEIDNQQNHPHEAGLLKLDISKANDELKWYPKYNSEDAIKYTIKWYKQFNDNRAIIDVFTETQIREYLYA